MPQNWYLRRNPVCDFGSNNARAKVRELKLRDIQPVVIYTLLRNGGPVQRIKRENPVTQVYSQQERRSDRFSQVRSQCIYYVNQSYLYVKRSIIEKKFTKRGTPQQSQCLGRGVLQNPRKGR